MSSKSYQKLADDISESYIKAGDDSVNMTEPNIEPAQSNPKTKATSGPFKRMPKTLDGKVYALPGEIISKNIEQLVVGQNAFVSIECIKTSEITSRDFDYSQEIETLRRMSKDEQRARLEASISFSDVLDMQPLELNDASSAPKLKKNSSIHAKRPTLTKFQELYLDIERNDQVDAIKVYLSKGKPSVLIPIEGNRRLTALQELKYSFVYVTLYPEPANAFELVKLSQSFNQKRDRHSIFDLGKQWAALVENKIKQETIAKEMGVSPAYVSKALSVNALYKGTRRALQENSDLFSERLVILIALFDKALGKEGMVDAWQTTLKLVLDVIDLRLEASLVEKLLNEKKKQLLTGKPKPNIAPSISPLSPNSLKVRSRFFAGEHSTPAGFLTVDSQNKSIRVGVDFSLLNSPREFLNEIQVLMEKHGLRQSVEPRIFSETEIGERLSSMEKDDIEKESELSDSLPNPIVNA